jgi:hypothetical protein
VQEYEELRIRVRSVGTRRYLVLANGPATAAGVIAVDREPSEYWEAFNRLIRIELGQEPAGALQVVAEHRKLGRDIFGLLFQEPLKRCLDESLVRAQSHRPPRGLRLRFDLPPELRDLPIESLTAPPASPMPSLALNNNLSLVRSLPGNPPGARLPDPQAPPEFIHLLVAVASPSGCELPPLESAEELDELQRKLLPLVTPVTTERATRGRLQQWLGDHADEPAAVLLLAHGVYDDAKGEGFVYLEEEDGSCDPVPGQLLGGMLVKAQRLRLVVLNLCAGGRSAQSEPFLGVAQALIGNGVPAVVAMQAQVSEAAAARLSPILLGRISANDTIDEAMTTARRQIANVPDSTDIEGSTPVLFLHERCHHGWLFKARGVVKRGQRLVDPLREGSDALARCTAGKGNFKPDDVLRAARFLRDTGDWGRVLDTARLSEPTMERQWLLEEAYVERVLGTLEELCTALADEGNPSPARALLATLRSRKSPENLPDALAACLTAEVEQAERLTSLLEQAEEAGTAGDWQTALDRYDEVLAERPLGFRDAVPRRAAAEEQLWLARAYATAEQELLAERWSEAARGYAEILDRAPGYQGANSLLPYAQARIAEAEGDWPAAVEAYGRCPDLPEAQARAAYAQGRVAAAGESWDVASDAFARALEREHPDDGWPGYAAGRAAEQASAWQTAVQAYGRAGELLDAPDRLLYAQGRLAAEGGEWLLALGAFQAFESHGGHAGPWPEQARGKVYEQAADAELAGDWEQSGRLFGAVPDHHDATARCRYAQARKHEEAGRWGPAAKAFAVTDHADAGVRLKYAKGRMCERRRQWEKALEHFKALPSHYLDVRDRLLYTAGRSADRRGDWRGVIEGFGGLPDDYEGGEVGRRRRYARARMAETQGQWSAVLESLGDLPGGDRSDAMRVLRQKAGGKLAEEEGDWSGAVEAYAPVAEADPELGRLHAYAQGRALETEQAWSGALEAYASLADDDRDVGARRAYANARLTEEAATDADGWRAAVAAYESLPADSLPAELEVRLRTGYARARLAEATGAWEEVVREARALGAYRDAAMLEDYAKGRNAEEQQAWEQAAGAYGRCITHRDAAGRQAYATGHLLEDAGEWSAAIEAYGRAPNPLPEASQRRQRVAGLLDALPWADGLPGAVLVADPCALRDDAFPYLALRHAGITPGSSTDEVKDADFVLLERGRMTWQERTAWEQLRSPAKRLELDALLYRLQDPDELGRRLAALEPGHLQDLVEELCQALPEDAPLLLLLARGRERAIEAWEDRLGRAPSDMSVVHSLAVAHFWHAQELEESGAWEHAELAWERALACWAALLTDDDHWGRWRQSRAVSYRHAVTQAAAARLRRELGQDLLDRLSAFADRHATQGRPERARTYRALLDTLEIELEGARALKEAGGLPLVGDANGRLACGRLYLRYTHLERPLGELVARLEQAAERGDDPGETALQRLRWAFSELAPAFTLSEHHRFGQALRALPALYRQSLAGLPPDCPGPPSDGTADAHTMSCEHCQGFIHHNPAYTFLPHRRARLLQDAVDLAVRAHLAIARTALTGGGGGLGRALEEWAEAIRVAENAAATVRAKQAIVRMVLGRVDALMGERGARRGACLDEAIDLIDQVVPLLGAVGRAALLARMAELLTDRGVWHGYGCHEFGFQPDLALAATDLRRALELNPESVRTRDNLVRALVFGIPGLPGADTPSGKLKLLGEALGILHEGLERTPGHGLFRETLDYALEGLEALVLEKRSFEEVAALMRASGERPPGPEGDRAARALELAGEADRKLRQDDLSGALYDLIRATRLDPGSGSIRRSLLDAVALELARLQPEGS